MKYLASLALFLMFTFSSSAEPIRVKFKTLSSNGDVLKGTTVKLYKGNRLVMIDEGASATTKWELDENSYYTIEVSLNGFITKRVGIFTQPSSTELSDYRYDFFLELEPLNSYSDIPDAGDALEYPAAIIQYDSEINALDFSKVYRNSSRMHMAELRMLAQFEEQ